MITISTSSSQKTSVPVTINPLALKTGIVKIDSHYFPYYMAHSTNLRAAMGFISSFGSSILKIWILCISWSITNNILINSIAKTCYTNLYYYCTERHTKWQCKTSHKPTEYPARFVNVPSRMQPNMNAAEKSLGNPLLVNYAHDYLITCLVPPKGNVA